MSYTKQNYVSGQTLYAAQLNAMDEQIAANEEAIAANAEAIAANAEAIGKKVSQEQLTDAVYEAVWSVTDGNAGQQGTESVEWVQGTLPGGVLNPGVNYAITTKDYLRKTIDKITPTNDFAVAVAMFTSDGTFVDYYHFDQNVMYKYYWTVSPFSLYDIVYPSCDLVKLVVQKNDTTQPAVGIEDAENIQLISKQGKYIIPCYKHIHGKKVSILGDSVSTYDGEIPSGYAHQYPNGDVTTFSDTWVGQLLEETGMELEVLEAYAGSRVTQTGELASGSHFVDDERISNLGNPDVIIVFGGTNDLFQENPPAVGEIPDYFSVSADDFNKAEFAGAYLYLLMKLKERYTNARIYCCNVTDFTRDITSAYWKNGNGLSKQKMGEIISKCCDIAGATFIDLLKCGMTWHNYSGYAYDGNLHPNKNGMKLIAEYIARKL